MHFIMFVLVISLAILTPFKAYAGTATQTDWSGGDGIWGPVIDWSNEFYADTDIECYNDPSNIILQKTIALIPQEHTVDETFPTPVSVYSADIDGDGCMDILGTSREGTGVDITWWENADGFGTSWVEHTVDGDFAGASSIYAADVNGDGYMDVLGAARYDDDITWWENMDGSGTSWTEHTLDGDFDGATSVYSVDVNADGYMDVLGAAYDGDEITWWENVDGSGTSWIEHNIDGDCNAPDCIYAADVNGDGDLDILGSVEYDNDILWWENIDGSGTSWTEHTIDGDYASPYSVFSADINGDGYMDVLGGSPAGYITWWDNIDGSGTSWIEYTIKSGFTQAFCVHSADLDNDGDMDVLGTAIMADDIAWWENSDGSGTIWIEHMLNNNYNGPHLACSGDINNDGNLDVVGCAYYDSDITWWDLTEFLPDGSLESSVLDVQESPDWQVLFWNCTEPSGTSVALQVRASDNSSSMGAWSDTLTGPCTLEGILADEDNYFQYKIILNTTDPLISPALHDVTLGWQPFTGTQEGSAGEVAQFALFGAQPNPALGHATMVFSLPADSKVELTVYDLSGRAVYSVTGEYSTGVHEVILEGLASGVYMVRMTSEEFTATRQFVMIE